MCAKEGCAANEQWDFAGCWKGGLEKREMLRGVRVATDDVTLGRSADRARGLLLPPGVARGRGRRIASLHLPLTLADLQKNAHIHCNRSAPTPPTARCKGESNDLGDRILCRSRTRKCATSASLSLLPITAPFVFSYWLQFNCTCVTNFNLILLTWWNVSQTLFQLIGKFQLLLTLTQENQSNLM